MKTMPVFLIVTVAMLAAQPAAAQDARWEPWYGCWERMTDRVTQASAESAEAEVADPAPVDVPQVCVEPAGDNAVRMTTTVPGQEPLEEMLVADGAPHPIDEGGCEGTEVVEWSANGQRLIARADVTCAGGTARTISGLALITPDDTWIDIRSVRFGDVPNTRVSRYYRIDAPQSVRVPAAGSPPLTLAELKEIAGKVDDEVLEAALVETNPRLPVSAGTLEDLADNGVSPGVLDLIVALAYPDRFVVERTGQIATITESAASRRYGLDDYYYSGFYYPAYYYSPFGYSYIGFYDPYLFSPYRFSGGGVLVIPPDVEGPVRGRAIAGQGYTRIRPAGEAGASPRTAVRRDGSTQAIGGRVSASGGSTTTRTASGRSSSGSSGGSSSSGSSGGSSSGGSSSGGASPRGYSGGGGGGRTAQPR